MPFGFPSESAFSFAGIPTTIGNALSHLALEWRAQAFEKAAAGELAWDEPERRSSKRTGQPSPRGAASDQGKATGTGRGSQAGQVEAESVMPPEEPRADQETTSAEMPPARPLPKRWQDVRIKFLNIRAVEIKVLGHPQRCNYKELGFTDRRTGEPTQAWLSLRKVAELEGHWGVRDLLDALEYENTRKGFQNLSKRMEEIRERLRAYFGLDEDPIPYVKGRGYSPRFHLDTAKWYNRVPGAGSDRAGL
jgi:hypothetical protein